MKFIFMWLGAALMLLSFSMNSTNASNFDGALDRMNLLDLSNLEMIPGDSYMAYTKTPISVISGQKHTLIMDEGFFGFHQAYFDQTSVRIQETNPLLEYNLPIQYDSVKRAYYVEFTPQSSAIHFIELPMDTNNYRAMLYIGGIESFIRYENFIQSTVTSREFGVVPIDYDMQLSPEAIKNLVTATNYAGTALPVSIEGSTYQAGVNPVGNYKMVLVTNYLDNYRRFELDIRVIDVTKPVITGPLTIDVPVTNLETLEQIKARFTIMDNADGEISYQNLIVVSDTYSNQTTVGTYSITFKAIDQNLNESLHTVSISITDTKAPVITGPLAIYLYTTSDPLTEAMILSKYSAYDFEENQTKEVTIKSNQYLQKRNPGVYSVQLESSDQSGNKRTFYLSIHVIDDREPYFHRDRLILTVSAANQMTHQQLIDYFYQEAQLQGGGVSDVRILMDEYSSNYTLGGSYYVYVNYVLDGEEQQARMLIHVKEEPKQNLFGLSAIILTPILIGTTLFFILKKRK